MATLQFFDYLYLALTFLVPGLIVLFVRSQFVTRRNMARPADFLPYLTVSIFYYACVYVVVYPFAHFDAFIAWMHEPGSKVLAWFVLIFLGPALLGGVLGINVQKDWFRGFLQRFGLNTIHALPAAWDWKFSKAGYSYVLVTLKDGTRFAGLLGSDSFISSDPAERDIYIQWTYDIDRDNNNKWIPRDGNGVLIAAGEIRTVEFWNYVEEDSP